MARYLDENGVARLWSRIQQLVYECSGSGGSGCSCQSLTTADIDSVTPIKCSQATCNLADYGTLVYEFTDTAHEESVE